MPHTFGNSGTDDGVTGSSSSGRGLLGISDQGEGVHGETNSTQFAAVAGIEKNPSSGIAAVFGSNLGTGPGIFGTSERGEGVHGETNSTQFAAVAGIEKNPSSGIAAVFGSNLGTGPGIFGASGRGEGVHGETNASNFAAVVGAAMNPSGTGAGVFGESRGTGPGVFGTSGRGEGVHGETNASNFAAVVGVAMNPSGTGAGIFGESRGKDPAGFFKGDVEVTGDVRLVGQDLAEIFHIEGAATVEPGTVMVISEGALRASTEPYDRCVAGVVSGAGSYRPGLILGGLQSQVEGPSIALAGRVYCLADAEHGPIVVGDLLTTSPTPGHAMSVAEHSRAFGAVIGKALHALPSGRGLIPILIALQ